MKTATIIDVEKTLATLKSAITANPSLEVEYGKKMADVVDLLTLKDGVTKDLGQAYTNAEKRWAVNYADEIDGCTKLNKLDKIKLYMVASSGYVRHHNNPDTKVKVEKWMSDKFSANATDAGQQAA